jgi:phosphohistidine phosphatase
MARLHIDLLVCSTAVRARATAKPLVDSLRCPVRYDQRIYAAHRDDLLSITWEFPEQATSVMIVGHNPSLEEFTELLCGRSPRYPTGALATLELDVEVWSRTAPGCATLIALVTPAELAT